MNTITVLIRRNLRIYFRDRASVFLSLLSALILLMLYLLFLGGLQVDELNSSVPNATSEDINWFVGSWVFAGILMITTFTTGFAALGVYVDDKSSGRFKEFRVSPIRRHELILGYQIAAFIISTLMSLIIFAVGLIFLLTVYGKTPTVDQSLFTVAYILLCAWAFSAFSSFVMTFVSSNSSYTAVSTIVGTLLGFLAGAYLPLGLVSKSIGNVLNVLPFSPAAMLIRRPLTEESLAAISGDMSEAQKQISEYYGVNLLVGDHFVEPVWAVAGLLVMGVIFTILGAWRIGRTIK